MSVQSRPKHANSSRAIEKDRKSKKVKLGSIGADISAAISAEKESDMNANSWVMSTGAYIYGFCGVYMYR